MKRNEARRYGNKSKHEVDIYDSFSFEWWNNQKYFSKTLNSFNLIRD